MTNYYELTEEITDVVLNCSLDGDSLQITNSKFIDLQNSNAIFIKLTKKQIKQINILLNEEKTK